MNIKDALTILRGRPAGAKPFTALLACGFTPLHLSTLLNAHLQLALPDRHVAVRSGTYGNLIGSIRAFDANTDHALCVTIEYQDLDPRLGLRESRRWSPALANDIVANARARLAQLLEAVVTAARDLPVVVAGPAMPIAPAFHAPPPRLSAARAAIDLELASFRARLTSEGRVVVLDQEHLGRGVDVAAYDPRSDLHTGFPYSVPFADRLAAALATGVAPQSPKKGIITDLDDTMWAGLVGEVGAEAVSWELATKTHHHALYQATLGSLLDEGALVAIASKNTASVAQAALARSDFGIDTQKIYPQEIHWEPKSSSVRRILAAWNIGADAVVFIDDSDYELAEVRAAFPQIECVKFPTHDPAAAVELLWRLRAWFGKSRVSEEDRIRAASIRDAAAFEQERTAAGGSMEFLASLGATVEFDFDAAAHDPRVLELINKTNQFNLNGTRYTAADWQRANERPGAIVASVAYTDKFGPLGKIAAFSGRVVADRLELDTWVLSCRAFARNIEHQCLRTLFAAYPAVEEIRLAYAATSKNAPLRAFLESIGVEFATGTVCVTRTSFAAHATALSHTVNFRVTQA